MSPIIIAAYELNPIMVNLQHSRLEDASLPSTKAIRSHWVCG